MSEQEPKGDQPDFSEEEIEAMERAIDSAPKIPPADPKFLASLKATILHNIKQNNLDGGAGQDALRAVREADTKPIVTGPYVKPPPLNPDGSLKKK